MYSNGTKFAMTLDGRALRHLDARQLACLAATILDEPGTFKPTVNQLANILHVTPAYIAVARKMPPIKCAAILAGFDKSSFMPLLRKSPPPWQPFALLAPNKTNEIDDSNLLALVREVGVGRVLDAAIAVEAAE